MSVFKWCHFQGEVILWAVRWYCRYGVSYRDLEQMMGERGVTVDHSTIYRWVQKFAPEIEKRLRWHWRRPRSTSWRVDETYVKVRGKWTYLYRTVDKFGNTIDFYLSPTRNAKAAKRFLGKALNGLKDWGEANGHQQRQGTDLRYRDFGVEGRRQVSRKACAPAGQILEQCRRGRSRQAQATDQACEGIQDAENSICDNQGIRSHAGFAQGPGGDFQSNRRYSWRSSHR
jgi:transposase, IS6 family